MKILVKLRWTCTIAVDHQHLKNQRVGYQSNQKCYHYQHSRNQLKNTADFRFSWTKRSFLFLTLPTQKSLKQLLAFLNLHQQSKNQFTSSIHSCDTVNFRVLWPDWSQAILTLPTQELFLLLCESVSTWKKLGYFINLFWRYCGLKNPAIWLAKNIWPVSQERNFFQILDLSSNTADNEHSNFRTNLVKITD